MSDSRIACRLDRMHSGRWRMRAKPPTSLNSRAFCAERSSASGSDLRPLPVVQNHLFLKDIPRQLFEEVCQLPCTMRRAFRVATHDGGNDSAVQARAFVESVGLFDISIPKTARVCVDDIHRRRQHLIMRSPDFGFVDLSVGVKIARTLSGLCRLCQLLCQCFQLATLGSGRALCGTHNHQLF